MDLGEPRCVSTRVVRNAQSKSGSEFRGDFYSVPSSAFPRFKILRLSSGFRLMSNRTWTCVRCRKSYRRVQAITAVACSTCHGPCEYVHSKIRVPSPKRVKAWDEFWAKYLAEKVQLATYHRGELRQGVTLELLRIQLPVNPGGRA